MSNKLFPDITKNDVTLRIAMEEASVLQN